MATSSVAWLDATNAAAKGAAASARPRASPEEIVVLVVCWVRLVFAATPWQPLASFRAEMESIHTEQVSRTKS